VKSTLQENQPLVLIVDDEAFNQKQLRPFLEREGYRVALAKNGANAISGKSNRTQLLPPQ
jgi:CheY-like chemotaxis protein